MGAPGEASATDPLSARGIRDVQLGGEMGRRVEVTACNHVRVLDLENDFLHRFQHRRSPAEIEAFDRFAGVGMLLDAAVLLASYSGDEADVAVKDQILEAILETQDSDGYIGAFEPQKDGSHSWAEYNFHESAYLVRGLLRDFELFASARSLEAARKLADHLIAVWPEIPQGVSLTTLGTAEAFLQLHAVTGDRRYLEFCSREPMGRRGRIRTMALREWEQPLVMAKELEDPGWNAEESDSRKLENIPDSICHMYRILSRCAMQLRLYRIEPDERLLVMSRRVFEAMTRHARGGMVITGTVSMSEGWHETQDGRGALGETCATVYLLRFLDELVQLEGDLHHGDIMERAIFNALFAAQSPDGRRLRYYTPFSGPRTCFDHDTYCCPGNFRRGVGRLPSWVYYRWKDGVAVNLYGPSSAVVRLDDGADLRLRQETDYPSSGRVVIHVAPSTAALFAVRLRTPVWCGQISISVNDESVAGDGTAGLGVIEIERQWHAGDVITLDMPMPWRLVKGREMQHGRVAVMRGPTVYCINPDRNPGLEGMSLRDLTVDPSSLSDPVPDDTIRPGGTACRLRAWSPGRSLDDPGDLDLVLSEFPDPGGREIYFRAPGADIGVEDELIAPPV